jgi:hypothetical protein
VSVDRIRDPTSSAGPWTRDVSVDRIRDPTSSAGPWTRDVSVDRIRDQLTLGAIAPPEVAAG